MPLDDEVKAEYDIELPPTIKPVVIGEPGGAQLELDQSNITAPTIKSESMPQEKEEDDLEDLFRGVKKDDLSDLADVSGLADVSDLVEVDEEEELDDLFEVPDEMFTVPEQHLNNKTKVKRTSKYYTGVDKPSDMGGLTT